MGYTNTTTNYKLPQFVGSDKLSILGDLNTALLKIDESMKLISNSIATEDNKVKSEIQTQINSLTSSISTINANILNLNTIKAEVESAREGSITLKDEINRKVFAGGNNLLHATSLRDECKPHEHWKIIGDGVSISNAWSPRGNKSFRYSVNNSSGLRGIAAQYSLHLSSRTTYTLQFNALKDLNFNESDGNLKIEIKYPTANGEKTHTKTLSPSDFNSNFWLHFNFSFTTEGIQNNELVTINFLVAVGESWHGNIADFTLEDGVSFRQWHPTPGDIVAECNYNLNNRGIIGMDTNRILKNFKHNDASNQSPWSYTAPEDCFCFGSAWAHANDQYTPIFTLDGVQILKIGSGNNTLINIPIKKGQTLSLVDYGAYDLNIFGIKR